jgi:phage gp46-like protein
MADVRVVQRAELGRILLDWALTPTGQLDDTEQLQTAVIIAVGTDRRANDDDILPDPRSDDRRGWWGDLKADTIWGGWPIGSRLWLLARAKITDSKAREGATTNRVETYLRECLQPFLDNRVASRMAVSATRTGLNSISASVTLYRGPTPAIALQFQDFWTEIAA